MIGSILPIGIGIVLALAVNGTEDVKAAIAAGATFGPTSLGIALNILRGGGILNTPVGQLIISAAVIDDMIALIVLSQLESLTGTIDAAGVLIPVISAALFLVVGGYVALFWIPPIVNKHVLTRVENQEKHGFVEMGIMFSFLIVLMPATYYAKASYLMGAFVAGLSFCTSHELHVAFVRQFKRVMQWLMRVFFAASIGFQVPIKDFASGVVIWQGLVFTLALIGKLLVGFLVPNFTQSRNFTGYHLRDCLITGFSMAAEGEFAFVIAVYSVDKELIDKDLYASVVLAVLLSTILPPFLLRFTISYYNKKTEADIRDMANAEMRRNHDLESVVESLADEKPSRSEQLAGDIQSMRAVFLCIQTQSEARWGMMLNLMKTMGNLGLDVIDHRAWHPRGVNSTLVNEIYARDSIEVKEKGSGQAILKERIAEITAALEKTINQPDGAKVKVSRWYPGVVEEIVTHVDENKKVTGKKTISLEQRLLTEATEQLDRKQNMQLTATKEKTVEEILAGMQDEKTSDIPIAEPADAGAGASPPRARRRRRQKMRSTPVVGGGLFGENKTSESKEEEGPRAHRPSGVSQWSSDFGGKRSGIRAEVIVDGESYNVRINNETLKALRTGYNGDTLDSRKFSTSGISIQPDEVNVVNRLQGYVRSMGSLTQIAETDEGESETSSVVEKVNKPSVDA